MQEIVFSLDAFKLLVWESISEETAILTQKQNMFPTQTKYIDVDLHVRKI